MNEQDDVYIKEYSLPETEVAKLFDKYRSLAKVFSGDDMIKVPRVLKVKDRTIFFEKLDLNEEETLNRVIYDRDNEVVKKYCYEAGFRLAYIHSKISSSDHVHGDFWGANIFLTKDKVWTVVDWEPPRATKTGDIDLYIKNKKELDLATFLLHTVWGNYPAKQWYKYLSPKNDWHKAFLEGYSSKEAVDDTLLKQFICHETKRVWKTLSTEEKFFKRSVKKIMYIYIVLIHFRLRKSFIQI